MHASGLFGASMLLLAMVSGAEASIVPRSDDVLVSTYTTGRRARPSIAATTGGHFLVVWRESRHEVPGTHVIGRKLDAAGLLVGTEFQVDAAGSSINIEPSIVRSRDYEFVVAWRSYEPDDTQRQRLLGRRIDANGGPIGTEFQINTPRDLEGEYFLDNPATAPVPGGGFVVVWASGAPRDGDYSSGPDSEVYVRRFTGDALAAGAETVVSDPAIGAYGTTEIHPDITTLGNGDFAVVWAKGETFDFFTHIDTVARRLDSRDNPREQRSR